ncbi:MAG: hypothetical protein LH465_04585 [Sphingomonas bacterium]|nr:hypothetical protein [Sphingomonas bacterium]
MSETPRPETAKQRRARLRWLTLAEIIAILAVAISGIGLWKGWHDDAPKPAIVSESTKSIPLTLRSTTEKDGSAVVLTAIEPVHAVQAVEISFPAALGISPIDQSGEVRLSASTFDDQLHKARQKAGMTKLTNGEERLPLLIVTQYIEGGAPREARAIYDLGYRIRDGGLFSGREIGLGGLSLVSRGGGGPKDALNRRWARQRP